MWQNLRQYDAYSKSVDGIEVKTKYGGIVTLASGIIVLVLFLSEFMLFCSTTVVNRMYVDTSPQSESLTLNVDIAMIHATCDDVAIDVSDSKGSKDILLSSNLKSQPYGDGGCRFSGQAQVQKVAGEISFTHTGSPDLFNLMEFLVFNASHVIHDLHFGPMIPSMVNPLIDVHKTIHQNVAVYKYFVKIVPTKYIYLYGKSVTTYQYSVTEHIRTPESAGQLIFPGVILSYEFSPITVEYIETKTTLLQFLTNTCAIVGGVFAVAAMIDRVIYKVSQKVD